MKADELALPPIVSRAEWLAARKRLLGREKAATRLRDQVNAERRRLPMVLIDKSYVFEGAAGQRTLRVSAAASSCVTARVSFTRIRRTHADSIRSIPR